MSETITVPVVVNHDNTAPPIGTLTIRRDALPPFPEFVLSPGWRFTQDGSGQYELVCVSIVPDPATAVPA